MNILQLTSHFSPNVGGVETHLDDLVKALVKRNHKVFVLTYRPLTTKTSWNIFEKRKNIKIFRIPWFPGFFYSLVHNPAIEFLYLVPGLFLVTPFVLLSEHIEVIHAHGLVAGFVGVFWGKMFHKRVAISTHNIYHFPKQGLYSSFVRWIFNGAQIVLCLSKQSAQEVQQLGVSEKKVSVFTYWIDLEKFKHIADAKQKVHISKQFTILFVGRLIKEKGVLQLLEAARKLKGKVQVLIAGTGPLEEVVVQAQQQGVVTYVGKISQENLPLYYSAADVLIVPSVHEEGFGRVMLESLACGTPVIAAKRGGIVEAISEKVGYLIDITPENIKKVVEYCNNHRVELENKSKEAIVFARHKYSEENIDTILSSYK